MNQHKFLIRFLQVIGLLYGFMFLTNMAHYSSIGLDFGFGSLTETQLRIRWPGNGSFWIGGSTVPVRSSGIYVDAAGAFWQTPQAPPKPRGKKQASGIFMNILHRIRNGILSASPVGYRWQGCYS